MITLTLTSSERDAMDWIGNRYAHGTDLYKLLWGKCVAIPTDADWDDPRDITFEVNDEVAHKIAHLLVGCLFDCVSDEFKKKLTTFRTSCINTLEK